MVLSCFLYLRRDLIHFFVARIPGARGCDEFSSVQRGFFAADLQLIDGDDGFGEWKNKSAQFILSVSVCVKCWLLVKSEE